MRIINPVYRTPATSDTEAYACSCRCSNISQTTKATGVSNNRCQCSCAYGETNMHANRDYAKSRI